MSKQSPKSTASTAPAPAAAPAKAPEPSAPTPAPTPAAAAGGADAEQSDFDKAVAIMKGDAVPDDDVAPAPKTKDDEDEADHSDDVPDAAEKAEHEPSEPEKKPEPKKDPTEKAVDKPADDKPQETRLEKSWAKLAEADRQLREEKARLKSEREQMQKDHERLASLEKSLKEDPFAVLKAAGIKDDDMLEIVAQRTLSGGKPGTHETATKANSEIDELRGEITKLRQEAVERDRQRKVDAYVGDVSRVISDERFDLLRSYPNAVNEVLKYAAGHFDQHGELLRPEDAAATIQEALIEQLQAASKTKTWQSIFASAPGETETARADEDEPPAPQQKKSQQPSAGKTLTNKHGQRTPPHTEDDDLEDEERIAQAARLVKFGPG